MCQKVESRARNTLGSDFSHGNSLDILNICMICAQNDNLRTWYFNFTTNYAQRIIYPFHVINFEKVETE